MNRTDIHINICIKPSCIFSHVFSVFWCNFSQCRYLLTSQAVLPNTVCQVPIFCSSVDNHATAVWIKSAAFTWKDDSLSCSQSASWLSTKYTSSNVLLLSSSLKYFCTFSNYFHFFFFVYSIFKHYEISCPRKQVSKTTEISKIKTWNQVSKNSVLDCKTCCESNCLRNWKLLPQKMKCVKELEIRWPGTWNKLSENLK